MDYKYKFEKFKYSNFPVYSSVQQGKGTIVIPHFHKAVELILVLSGECDIYIDTTVLYCSKNDVVFIPAHCVHTVIGNGDNTKIKGITFETSLLDAKIHDYSIEAALNKHEINNYIINCELETMRAIIKDFSLEEEEKSAVFRFEILSRLYKLGSIIMKNYNSISNIGYNRLKPVIDYIKENYRHTIHTSEMSALINVCNDHFIRLFKAATNKSPIKYINDLRIEQALKLLVDSDLSITEISEAVGFSNVNYMIKTFKNNLNVTPSAYRKKLKSK